MISQVSSLALGGAGVTSFNGRTGVVVPVTGDVSADLITDSATRGMIFITQRAKLLTVATGAEVNPTSLDFLVDGTTRAAVPVTALTRIANLPADTSAAIAAVSALAAAGGGGSGGTGSIFVRTAFQPVTLTSVANMEPGTTNRIFANLASAMRCGLEVTHGNVVGRTGQEIKIQYTLDTNSSSTSTWFDFGASIDGADSANVASGVRSALVTVPDTAKLANGTWVRIFVSGGASASNVMKNMNFVVEVPAGRQGEDGAPGVDGDPGTGMRTTYLMDITGNVINQVFAAGTDVPITLVSAYLEPLSGSARFGFLRGSTTVMETKSNANSWTLNGVSTTFPFNVATPQTLGAYGKLSIRVTNASALSGIIFGIKGDPT